MRTGFAILFLSIIGLGVNAQDTPSKGFSNPKEDMTVIDFFTVNCNDKIWDIKWKALSEIESCIYVLEYSSDQTNWVEYKTIAGTAHTSGVYNYSEFMKRTSDSVRYFRLQYDCTSSVQMFKNPVMNICPEYIPDEATQPSFIVEYNNSEGVLQLEGSGSGSEKSTVMVYTGIGQLVYQNEIALNPANGKIIVPITAKSHEVLIVKINNGSKSISKKIIIP